MTALGSYSLDDHEVGKKDTIMRTTLAICTLTFVLLSTSYCQKRVYLGILSNVQFVISDPTGRKSGTDPRYSKPKEQWVRLNEIPGAGYRETYDQDDEPAKTQFETHLQSPEDDGTFTIEVIADTTKNAFLTVDVVSETDGTPVQTPFYAIKAIPVERDSAITYHFVYHGSIGDSVGLVKVISARSIRQDVAAMNKLGWINGQSTADKYSGLIMLYGVQMQKSDFAGARAALTSILQSISPDSSLTLTSDACNTIRPDVQYLLSQLPSAPASGVNVKLVNSTGIKLTTGSLQYYDGSWKDAINNGDGTFRVNTNLASVSLRMTYEGGSQTKNNMPIGYDTVAFQTVNTQVKLQNSTGSPIDTGTVQYYYSSWKAFGHTVNGVAMAELLPANYTFRMTYAATTNDKQQDIGTNATVVFSTVNAAIQLKNSAGSLIDQGAVQYYFSSWHALGNTVNGVAAKELLPANYTFRMTYATATNDKQQNISTNPTVVFQTVSASVQLQNSQGALIDTGTVQYYFSSWQALGNTVNGMATKELLPANYTFRMSYASASKDKQQNIGTNPTVVFNTVNATVQLKNSLGAFIDQGTVQYYFSSWKTLGQTMNGVATKELLPASYTFRMTYETVTNDKAQDISTNSMVSFSTVLCTVTVKNGQGQPVDGAQVSYYFSSWVPIGATVGGQVTKELLPANLTFRETIGPATQNKVQIIGTNALVEFVTQ